MSQVIRITPEETYPKDKIAEINKTLTELLGKKKLFDDLVQKGDDFYARKDLYQAKDQYQAPVAMNFLAVIYAHTGHADEAMDLVERLLTMNYDDPLTVQMLRLDPSLDPLRDNPRFKELLKRSS